MTGIVPRPDYRLGPVVFIAQRNEARRAQQEVPAARPVETEPAHGEHPQELVGPLPIRDFRRIHAELPGVILHTIC
jgi:hypothetical protein